MHDTLKEAPSIRVHVIEVLAHSRKALGFLRSRINLEPEAVVLDRFYHGCRGIRGDFGSTRTAGKGDFAKQSAARRGKNSQHEIFALNSSPAEWTGL